MIIILSPPSPGVCGEAPAGVHPAGGLGPGLRAAAGSGSPDHGAGSVLVSGFDLGPELQDRIQTERSRPQSGLPQDPEAPQRPGQVHGTGSASICAGSGSFFLFCLMVPMSNLLSSSVSTPAGQYVLQ